MEIVNTWLPILTSMAGTIGVLAYLIKSNREVIEAKLDHVTDVTDRRLTALETDVSLIKEHLLSAKRA